MMNETLFKFATGKNIYMTTRKVKRETTNLLKNNNTSEIYLEKFLSNSQVAKK